MSDFKAEMHQIHRLGLRPRPRWGSCGLGELIALSWFAFVKSK